MLQWVYPSRLTDPSSKLSFLERLLFVRGIKTEEEKKHFLSPDYERDLHDPFLFRDMEKVVKRIGQAKATGETVGVFGDFDADGVTSSVIICEALKALHIPTLPYLPDKIKEGHGFSKQAVEYFSEKGVKLVLTLDCGMMNHAEIREAKKRGIDTIVIDHHHVPPVLPEAWAIVNPKLPEETYPFRELCGAGTSFKVAWALYERFLPEEKDQLKWLLDVVATGTVADVMPLVGENRVLVKYGLIVFEKTRRVGFQEMLVVGEIARRSGGGTFPDSRTLGFQIAPRINAASRMAHPLLAHNLLMESDRVKARGLALELEAYNLARQKVSQATTEKIREVAKREFADKKFIFAVDPHYPIGVIGLVAGKIAEEFGKPTCILEKGVTESRGSFRSIPGFNIIETLEECSKLVKKFGGHEQAAGMTIGNEKLDLFYEKFNALVEKKLTGKKTEPELLIDLVLKPEEITLEAVQSLTELEPFGEGNHEPVFVLEDMTVLEARTVGKDGQHWKLKLKNGGQPKIFDAVGWSLVETIPALKSGDRIDIACELSVNTWNGGTTVQLKLLDIRKGKRS